MNCNNNIDNSNQSEVYSFEPCSSKPRWSVKQKIDLLASLHTVDRKIIQREYGVNPAQLSSRISKIKKEQDEIKINLCSQKIGHHAFLAKVTDNNHDWKIIATEVGVDPEVCERDWHALMVIESWPKGPTIEQYINYLVNYTKKRDFVEYHCLQMISRIKKTRKLQTEILVDLSSKLFISKKITSNEYAQLVIANNQDWSSIAAYMGVTSEICENYWLVHNLFDSWCLRKQPSNNDKVSHIEQDEIGFDLLLNWDGVGKIFK